MYFRANNKNSKNISLNESIGFDKEGNEIAIIDILKSPKPDFIDELDKKDNVELLKKYLNILNSPITTTFPLSGPIPTPDRTEPNKAAASAAAFSIEFR